VLIPAISPSTQYMIDYLETFMLGLQAKGRWRTLVKADKMVKDTASSDTAGYPSEV
jgi:hypothetical protein